MFFDPRNRFPMLFLPQNVHGMSYGHTHIWPWEYFENFHFTRIHHDGCLQLCFLTRGIDYQCCFCPKMLMEWVISTSICDLQRGNFLVFSEMNCNGCQLYGYFRLLPQNFYAMCCDHTCHLYIWSHLYIWPWSWEDLKVYLFSKYIMIPILMVIIGCIWYYLDLKCSRHLITWICNVLLQIN